MELPHEYKKPPTSLGEWIIAVLVKRLPLVGLIMLIVWATGKNTQPEKATWAKAELIVKAIILAAVLIFVAVIGFGVFTNFANDVDWSEYK
jgi:amino acid transporter